MATNLIAQNFKLSSDKSQIVSDAVLLSLETGTKVLDGTGKEFIKVESNIFDLVDRDFVTHDELPIDRIGQIAFKDEENTFIKTNTFRDIIPSTSNTYSVGSDSKKWGNLYSTKVTINGITVEKLSSSSENTSLYLPKVTGDYVHTIAQGNKNGLGSSTKAIYLASNGELKECTNSIDVFKASGANAKEGIVPKPSTTAGTSKFLREDATWSDLPVATASALGVVKVGNYINVSSGKISVDQASTTDYGVVKVGHALKIGSNGTLGVDEDSLNIPDQDRIAYVDRENTFTENNNFNNILPNSNNTYNLGDTNNKWSKVYTNTLNLSGSDVTIEAGTSTTSAVGSPTKPIYLDANGVPKVCGDVDLSLHPYKLWKFTSSAGLGILLYKDLSDTSTYPKGFDGETTVGFYHVKFLTSDTQGAPLCDDINATATDGILMVHGITSCSGVSSNQRVLQLFYRIGNTISLRIYMRRGRYVSGEWVWDSLWSDAGLSYGSVKTVYSYNQYRIGQTADGSQLYTSPGNSNTIMSGQLVGTWRVTSDGVFHHDYESNTSTTSGGSIYSKGPVFKCTVKEIL